MINQTYKKPPITEAIIEIKFTSSIDDVTFEKAKKKFDSEYTQSEKIINNNLLVNQPSTGSESPVVNINTVTGTRFSNDDMTELLLLWSNSMVVSQLAPYKGFESFAKRFIKDFNFLKRVTGHREISRIGVRYINRIDIPIFGESLDYESYLNIYPQLPKNLSTVDAYAIHTLTKIPELECKLLINSAVVESPLINHASFIVDVDIFSDIDIPQNEKDISNLLHNIRNKKNEIFESFITDSARKLFE